MSAAREADKPRISDEKDGASSIPNCECPVCFEIMTEKTCFVAISNLAGAAAHTYCKDCATSLLGKADPQNQAAKIVATRPYPGYITELQTIDQQLAAEKHCLTKEFQMKLMSELEKQKREFEEQLRREQDKSRDLQKKLEQTGDYEARYKKLEEQTTQFLSQALQATERESKAHAEKLKLEQESTAKIRALKESLTQAASESDHLNSIILEQKGTLEIEKTKTQILTQELQDLSELLHQFALSSVRANRTIQKVLGQTDSITPRPRAVSDATVTQQERDKEQKMPGSDTGSSTTETKQEPSASPTRRQSFTSSFDYETLRKRSDTLRAAATQHSNGSHSVPVSPVPSSVSGASSVSSVRRASSTSFGASLTPSPSPSTSPATSHPNLWRRAMTRYDAPPPLPISPIPGASSPLLSAPPTTTATSVFPGSFLPRPPSRPSSPVPGAASSPSAASTTRLVLTRRDA